MVFLFFFFGWGGQPFKASGSCPGTASLQVAHRPHPPTSRQTSIQSGGARKLRTSLSECPVGVTRLRTQAVQAPLAWAVGTTTERHPSSREKSTGHHCVDRTLHEAAPGIHGMCVVDTKKRKETKPQGTGPKTLKTTTFYSDFRVK